eukprot:gene10297-13843_t
MKNNSDSKRLKPKTLRPSTSGKQSVENILSQTIRNSFANEGRRESISNGSLSMPPIITNHQISSSLLIPNSRLKANEALAYTNENRSITNPLSFLPLDISLFVPDSNDNSLASPTTGRYSRRSVGQSRVHNPTHTQSMSVLETSSSHRNNDNISYLNSDLGSITNSYLSYSMSLSQSGSEFGSSDDWQNRQSTSRNTSRRNAISNGTKNTTRLLRTSFSGLGSDKINDREHPLTTREMIEDISNRVKNSQNPPDYVMPLNELPSSYIAWDSQISSHINNSNGIAKPTINIIGCLQPLDLVLAKADERARKQTTYSRRSFVNQEIRIKEIEDAIEYKHNKSERIAEAVARNHRQRLWLPILQVLHFLRVIRPQAELAIRMHRMVQSNYKLLLRIHYSVLNWYNRHIFIKYRLRLFRLRKSGTITFTMKLRVRRKRRAANLMTLFLVDHKRFYMIKRVLHRFFSAIHMIQRSIRSFLVINKGRLVLLTLLWDKFEIEMVQKFLFKRQQLAESQKKIFERKPIIHQSKSKKMARVRMNNDNNNITDEVPVDSLPPVHRSVNKFSNIEKKWVAIESRLDKKIVELREKGVMEMEPELDLIRKNMIPHEHKRDQIIELMRIIRKHHFSTQLYRAAEQQRVRLQKLVSKQVYGMSDAKDLITGRKEFIPIMFDDSIRNYVPSDPLNLIGYKRIIWDYVEEKRMIFETSRRKTEE